MGYNGAPKGMRHCFEIGCANDSEGHCIRSVHAEANAIMKAKCDIRGAELFCTYLPCIECCKIIINVGIVKIYYIYDYFDKRSVLLEYSSQIEFLKEGKIQIEKINIQDLQI